MLAPLHRELLQLLLEQLVLNIVEDTLVQIQDYLTIHRRDLVLYPVDFALHPVKRLGIAVERLLVQGGWELPLFVVLLVKEGRTQDRVLRVFKSISTPHGMLAEVLCNA